MKDKNAKLLAKLRRLYPTYHWNYDQCNLGKFSYKEDAFQDTYLSYEEAEHFVYLAVRNAKLRLEEVQRIAAE